MKQLLTALFLLISICSFGQIKKPTKGTIALDSMTIKGKYISDTTKIVIFFIATDGSVVWKKGYQIRSVFAYSQAEGLPVQTRILDEHFNSFKKEEIGAMVEVKGFDWEK